MRARVERLQREITESYGEEGLLMVAMELMGDKNMLKVRSPSHDHTPFVSLILINNISLTLF